MTRDGIAGLICLAVAIGMLVLTRGLPQSSFVPIGPDFYPRIVLIIMVVLSVILIASDVLRKRKSAADTPTGAQSPAEKRNYRLVGITFSVFAVYVVLLPLLGYRLATLIFIAALQGVFQPPHGARGWILLLVSALATTVLTYVVFEHYLSVLLPRGNWTGW